jgi:hypothetical protein
MRKLSQEEILKMISNINEETEPEVKRYLDKFFEEYTDITAFENVTYTGEEHQKLESAIVHLVQLSTMTSVKVILNVLQELGAIDLIGSDKE